MGRYETLADWINRERLWRCPQCGFEVISVDRPACPDDPSTDMVEADE